MNCDFSQGLTCSRCGYRARKANTFRRCRPPAEPAPIMLGDLVAAGLERIGITKAAVSAIVGGDCGCERRQSWLNEASVAVQRWARRAVRAAARFYGLR